MDKDDWQESKNNADTDEDRPTTEILDERSQINRDDIDSPPLGTCDNCGRDLDENNTTIEAHWHRYDGSDQSSANGWVQYCVNCFPPGIPRP
jgi:hypothetical protein